MKGEKENGKKERSKKDEPLVEVLDGYIWDQCHPVHLPLLHHDGMCSSKLGPGR